MSAKAYILPYDHQSTGPVVEGLDAANLWALTPHGEKPLKVGTTRIFYNTPSSSQVTAISSLGEGYASKNANQKRELIRKSIGNAVKDLKTHEGIKDVVVDASLDPQAAGEQRRKIFGCFLNWFSFFLFAQLWLLIWHCTNSP
jgi:aminopeptidase